MRYINPRYLLTYLLTYLLDVKINSRSGFLYACPPKSNYLWPSAPVAIIAA